MVDRVVEMADACVKHIRNIAAGHGDAATQAAAAAYTRESILRGIHYFRVQNATEQRAVLESLPAFVAERGGRVKLVVVDSVAFHYRQDFEDMHLRTRILGQMNGARISARKHPLVSVSVGGPIPDRTTSRFRGRVRRGSRLRCADASVCAVPQRF